MKNRRPGKSAASMTLEASIVLPMFIFFFLNIMSAIIMIQTQCELEAALHQTGNEIALRAFDISEGEQLLGESDGLGFGLLEKGGMTVYAATKIKNDLGKKLSKNPVMDGAQSLNFLSSRISLRVLTLYLDSSSFLMPAIAFKTISLVSLIDFKYSITNSLNVLELIFASFTNCSIN